MISFNLLKHLILMNNSESSSLSDDNHFEGGGPQTDGGGPVAGSYASGTYGKAIDDAKSLLTSLYEIRNQDFKLGFDFSNLDDNEL